MQHQLAQNETIVAVFRDQDGQEVGTGFRTRSIRIQNVDSLNLRGEIQGDKGVPRGIASERR